MRRSPPATARSGSSPTWPRPITTSASCSKDQGRYDEAIAAFSRAIALKPDYAKAHNNLGIALKDQGRPDEAIAAYNRAIAARARLCRGP